MKKPRKAQFKIITKLVGKVVIFTKNRKIEIIAKIKTTNVLK